MVRSVAIGLVGLIAIVLALLLTFWRDADDERTLKEVTQVAPAAPESEREIKPKFQENLQQITKSLNAKPQSLKRILPSFDVVRVNQAGDAVIAGRASPGARITVLDGDVSVGTVTADRNGEWVLVPEKAMRSGNRTLSILAEMPNGDRLRSEDVVVLAVPEITNHLKTPLAVLVPRDGKETKKILQGPKSRDLASRTIELTLDIVDYDEAGRLRLLGKANSENLTVVYLNNMPIGQTEVAADGNWELRPKSRVAPGVYTLRVDEVKVGRVIARIELPFSRAAPIDKLKQEEYVIVQPGNSLWRISRRILGQGTMYSVIYEANKDQIRDADLIYPGQVFAVPKVN